ncbi:MAG: hypothetical protein KatS3mg124_1023 [Porticoccaceae bacterium]|nr:MAG: hypothetical protein KatS3mg124_1023 [Porticoccaceae bacterium]
MTEPPPLFDLTPLREHLARGGTVVTATRRLARAVRSAWHADCVRRGLDVWSEPEILPLESWIERRWLELVDRAFPPALAGLPATPHQERHLWRQVVAEEALDPAAMAELAREGWALARDWRLAPEVLAALHHEGAKKLARWGTTFRRALADAGLMEAGSRAELVLAGYRQGLLPPAPPIRLVGFTTLTPLARAVLEAATGDLEALRPPPRRGSVHRFQAPTTAAELGHAARWAVERAAREGVRVGVVIPRLTQLHDAVERIFLDHFHPAAVLPDAPPRPASFDISASRPLARVAPVGSALALLDLLRPELPSSALADRLNDPWWGDAEREWEERSRVLGELRRLEAPRLHPLRVARLAAQLAGDAPSPLARRLLSAASAARPQRRRRRYGEWATVFARALDALGWPGSRTLWSAEYQALETWRALLADLAKLDRVSPPATLEEALATLSELAWQTPFHPEAPAVPVWVLGTLEAVGLSFDHLWVANLEDRDWPAPTAPHPLLPAELQRRLGMPRADPIKELAIAGDLLAGFAAAAPEVVLSHARREGDLDLRPARLLMEFPPLDVSCRETADRHPWWNPVAASRSLEVVANGKGPPLAGERLPAGTRFLEDQARCPFVAFARHRLAAEPPAVPRSGLPRTLRGVVMHRALDRLWGALGDHKALCALYPQELRQRIEQAVAEAFAELFRRNRPWPRAGDFGATLLALERARLVRLLEQWLAQEAKRPPFAVAARELPLRWRLEPFYLEVRLDRIDRLADGNRLVIDYKSSDAPLPTREGPLWNLQLAVYACALADQEAPPAGLFYARVHPRHLGFAGLARRELNLSPVAKGSQAQFVEDWEGLLAAWRRSLAVLAAEIARGEAVVEARHPEGVGAEWWALSRWPEFERLSELVVEGGDGQ